MRDLSFFGKIFLALQPVDFRKQAHGLSIIVEHTLRINPLSGRCLFVFTNKRKNAIKTLYWDETGFGMWWKVLEKDKFRWPKDANDIKTISPKELRWLLEGIDIAKMKKHKKIEFQ